MTSSFNKRKKIAFIIWLYGGLYGARWRRDLAVSILMHWDLDFIQELPNHFHIITDFCVRMRKEAQRGRGSVPTLISLLKILKEKHGDVISSEIILEALRILSVHEASAEFTSMLENPEEWRHREIAKELEKSATIETITSGLSTRLAHIVEKEFLNERDYWIEYLFSALTICMTPESKRILRLVLRKGRKTPVLYELLKVQNLDISWLDDLLYKYESTDTSCFKLICRVIGRIPDSRSLETLLKFYKSPKTSEGATSGISEMIEGIPFPLEDVALAEFEKVLRESWELGSYDSQAMAIGNLYEKFLATIHFKDPDTRHCAKMIKLWTTEKLERLLQHFSPIDEYLNITEIPKEISYFEGTIEELLNNLKDFDKPQYEKYPRLHEKKPYYCGKYYAVFGGGWEFSFDFYGAITVALFRWERGTYGCCSYDHSSWLVKPPHAETLGLASFFKVLVSTEPIA